MFYPSQIKFLNPDKWGQGLFKKFWWMMKRVNSKHVSLSMMIHIMKGNYGIPFQLLLTTWTFDGQNVVFFSKYTIAVINYYDTISIEQGLPIH